RVSCASGSRPNRHGRGSCGFTRRRREGRWRRNTPTTKAATTRFTRWAPRAPRTQQIIPEETGLKDVVDPLGGSYFVEALTSELEREVLAYFDAIDRMGGMGAASQRAYPQLDT